MKLFTPTEYMSSILAQSADTHIRCKNMELYFPVDYHMKELTVDIFGSQPIFNLTDMNGKFQWLKTLVYLVFG